MFIDIIITIEQKTIDSRFVQRNSVRKFKVIVLNINL